MHAASDEKRSLLMPVNKRYPLKQLLEACKEYIKTTGRQVTFEYALIKGLNSSLQDAQALSKIIKGLRIAKVNLIPSNAIDEYGVGPPEKTEIQLFKGYLVKSGVHVTIRKSRGEDIEAACGQLRLRYEK